jgi:hypothetical protein
MWSNTAQEDVGSVDLRLRPMKPLVEATTAPVMIAAHRWALGQVWGAACSVNSWWHIGVSSG